MLNSIAILSDVHANLPAMEAVLRDANDLGITQFVFLGDIVGYGASPAECVKLVRGLGGCCVMGNHDAAIGYVRKRGCTFLNPDWKHSGYQAGLAHAGASLDAAQAEWLAALPYCMKIQGAHVAHGSLHEPEEFHYIQDSLSARPTLELLNKGKRKTAFFGHTHVAGIFSENDQSLEWLSETKVIIPDHLACAVTVGAVGQPRNDPDHDASWVIWSPDDHIVEFRKTNYDRLQAAREILKAGLPYESAWRLLRDDEKHLLVR